MLAYFVQVYLGTQRAPAWAFFTVASIAAAIAAGGMLLEFHKHATAGVIFDNTVWLYVLAGACMEIFFCSLAYALGRSFNWLYRRFNTVDRPTEPAA